MEFKRAHTDEQRTQRRRQILDTTAEMLAEMPVAKLSLNELSRRAGLAKSNVLRYFESREAILLELLDRQQQEWMTELARTLRPSPGTLRERGDRLAADLAGSLAHRPVLCDLISAQASVLEHNISPALALRYKRATRAALEDQVRLIVRCLPELGVQDAVRLVAVTLLIATSAWPYSNPPEAMLAAYAADPAVAALRTDFTEILRQTLAVTITGLLARGEDIAIGAAPIDIGRPSSAG